MSLNDILNNNNSSSLGGIRDDTEITPELLEENLDEYRELIAYWRQYPDLFIDYMCSLDPDCTFRFFFYQRLFLRASLRFKNVYATFVRAWSKSFMSVMALMCKAILYPGSKLFSVAGGKEQSAQILRDKLDEICTLIPPLANEIIWDTRGTRAETRQTKDSVKYTFKNGSVLENIAASDKTRGRRFHSGLMEECVGIDQDILNEVIIPTLNVNRPLPCGGTDPGEFINKSQVFITTAGYKNTFSYEKLMEFLCRAVARPKSTIVLGGSWKTPVVEGLLDKEFISDLKLDGTYNEASFDREYMSLWTGDVESAFFESEKFEKMRTLQLPEHKYNNGVSKNGYYVIGVDVGRHDDQTEIAVLKVSPLPSGYMKKQLVNLITIEGNTIQQALQIKKIFQKFKCRAAVVDGNGPGEGLVDMLTTDQIDPEDERMYAGLGVINDVERDDGRWRYKETYTENTIRNAMYVMKANVALNSEMYSYCKNQMSMGRLRFLIDETTAKNRLMSQAQGQKMSAAKRAEYLLPYVQTSILRDQLLNLIEENEGAHVILKQDNKKIKKDKVSALVYGLYYCKMQEDKRGGRKRNFNVKDLMLFNGSFKIKGKSE